MIETPEGAARRPGHIAILHASPARLGFLLPSSSPAKNTERQRAAYPYVRGVHEAAKDRGRGARKDDSDQEIVFSGQWSPDT